VVRFVRHPTVNWSDLENLNQESEESQYSKQALKEMLERKRQNDFVRKREFDQLRKLRQAQLSKTAVTPGLPRDSDPTGPSSFAHCPKLRAGRARRNHQEDRRDRSADGPAMVARQAGCRCRHHAAAAARGRWQHAFGFKTQPLSISTLPLLQDVLPSDLELPQSGGRAILLLAWPAWRDGLFAGVCHDRGFCPTDINMVPPSFARFEHDAALEDAAIALPAVTASAEPVSRP
jgi:hypothetical protein